MRAIGFIVLAAAVGSATLPAAGQEGQPGRGQRGQFGRQAGLSGEDQKAAWELQAKGVATGMKLDEAVTTKLVEIYLSVREGHGKALQGYMQTIREQMRERGGGAGGDRPQRRGGGGEGDRPQRRGGGDRPAFGSEARERINEITVEQREVLKKKLSEIIEGDQLDRSVRILGIFDRQWDRMVHTLAGFDLGDEQTLIALWPLEDYVVAVHEARSPDADREAAAQATREAREKLLEAFSDILSTDELNQFRRSLGGGRGGQAMIDRFDENGDGKLQRDEVPEQMAQSFDRMDRNGDGVIDESEIGGGRRGGGGGGRIID